MSLSRTLRKETDYKEKSDSKQWAVKSKNISRNTVNLVFVYFFINAMVGSKQDKGTRPIHLSSFNGVQNV
jgi:hypothetical protein